MKPLIFGIICYGWMQAASAQSSLRPNLYSPGQALAYYNAAVALPDTTVRHSLWVYGKYKSVDSEVWNKPMTLWAHYLGSAGHQNSFYSAGYLSDTYSFYTRQTIYAGYGYRLKVFKTRMLSLGIRAVFNLDRIRWDRWLPSSRTGINTHLTPDLDLGVAYQGSHLALGISAKNVWGNQVKYDSETLLKNQRELYLSLAYTFYLGRAATIMPFTLVRLERSLDADLGAQANLFGRLTMSYLFRLPELRSVYALTVRPYKSFLLGFSYDHSLIHRDHNLDGLIGYSF